MEASVGKVTRNSPRAKMAVLIAALIVFGFAVSLGVLFVFAGGKNKFKSPSVSSRSARISGVFLDSVLLSLIGDHNETMFAPKEAWMENIIENYESIPLRKGIVGTRLCVRLDYSDSGPFTEHTWLNELEMKLNGKKPKPMGGVQHTARV